ncbi:carbon-nitrogen hydrolase family protein [Amycolatopsis magusensis]|uniref:carbon-nitrogen hydrolase family protein n=1 Tax=Amycolatopsis magusensis TaxID=882444 RepID=UPI0024A9FB95|nr:carbon-nitrogen hydrolase family protein [Amycolatopsis magusensis]MDI5980024.1 carbon-nitrogen hydrolase family protein [Amycolatopsis magusensis]
MVPKLKVATCQFPVSADIARNTGYVRRQMRTARQRGARVAHFPECALSGYAVADFESHDGFDWPALEDAVGRIGELAAELRMWVVLGSAHRLSEGNKPHNSLYLIDDAGELVDRYDKRFCASVDLAHYSPGDHRSVFTIDGVRCGALICYEYRFPELYREYRREGVELVFHSYHAGNVPAGELADRPYPAATMPPSMIAAAAANHVWISCPNSSAPQSCWGAFFVRADGIVTGRLPRNRAGVLVSEVDTDAALYDSTARWRGRAMDGVLHSGDLVDDPRSRARTGFGPRTGRLGS